MEAAEKEEKVFLKREFVEVIRKESISWCQKAKVKLKWAKGGEIVILISSIGQAVGIPQV